MTLARNVHLAGPRCAEYWRSPPAATTRLGICRKRHASVEEAEEDVRELLEVAGVELVPITAKEAETALSAFSRYGKGRGHPAQLNLGDCFAYAVAKNHRRALLFKGDDFDKTDIRSASHSR